MLKKLIKHDFKAVARTWWIIAVVVLCMSIIGAYMLTLVSKSAENETFSLIDVVGVLFIIACVFAIIGSIIATVSLAFNRYYKNLFTDEGYLTFTLPVSRRDILLSKTINTFIWIILQGVLTVLCIGIFALFGMSAAESVFEFDISLFSDLLSTLLPEAELGLWIPVFIVESILLAIVTLIFYICLVQLSITVGAVMVNRAKVVVGILVYYAINTVVSWITQLCMTVATILFDSEMGIILTNAGINQWCGVSAFAVLIYTVMMVAFTTVVFFVTQGILERKLNIA